MSEQSVIAVYDDLSKAEVAVMALDQNGFPMAQVSIVTTLKHYRGVRPTKSTQKGRK